MRIGVYGRLFLVVFGVVAGLLLVHFRLALYHLGELGDEIDQRAYLEVARDLRGRLDSLITSDLQFKDRHSAEFADLHAANPELEIYLVGQDGAVLDRSPESATLTRFETDPLEMMLTNADANLPLRIYGWPARSIPRIFSAARLTSPSRSGYFLVLIAPSVSSIVHTPALVNRVLRGLGVGFALTAIFGLLVAGFTVLLLSRQFRALLVGIDAYRRGDPQPVPVVGTGEASYLARRYNEMIAHLEDRRAELHGIEQSRRALVANLVHDLRTPLGAVQGFLGLLAMRGADHDYDRKRHFVSTAYSSALSHRTLLESLSELAALDAKERAPSFERLPMETIAAEILERVEPRASEKGLELVLEIVGGPPPVPVDRSMMERVLTNFLSNAIRYTPDGGKITVTVSAAENGARVAVRDTGIGIPEEKQPYIFEEFYRAHKGLPEDIGGTGLGLGIVKRILALHGSVPELWSKPGEGTELSFLLTHEPMLTASQRNELVKVEQRAHLPESRVPPGSRLILGLSFVQLALVMATGKIFVAGYQIPSLYLAVVIVSLGIDGGARRMRDGSSWLPQALALFALVLAGSVSGFFVPFEIAARDGDPRTIYETAMIYVIPLAVLLLPQFSRAERIAFCSSFAIGSVWTFYTVWRTELIGLGIFSAFVLAISLALSVRRDTLATRLCAAFIGVVAMLGFFQGYQSTTIWTDELRRYEVERGARQLAVPMMNLARDLCVPGAEPAALLRKVGMAAPSRRFAVADLTNRDGTVIVNPTLNGGVFYGKDDPLILLDALPSEGVPQLVRMTGMNTSLWHSEVISAPLCGNLLRRVVARPRSPLVNVLERQLAEKHVFEYLIASSTQMLALTALLGLALLLGVSRRLKVVAATAGLWEQGKLTERIPPLGEDEVGLLAKQFNGLAEATQHELEKVRQADEQRRLFVGSVASGLGPPCERTVDALAALHARAAAGSELDPMQLRSLAREVNAQIRLVNDLFELSKVESERRRAECEKFSVAEVASDTVGEIASHAAERGVKIDLDVRGENVLGFGDIGMIARALELMLGAAAERTERPGPVRVIVKTDDGSGGGRTHGSGSKRGAVEITYPSQVAPGTSKESTSGRFTGPGSIELLIAAYLLERTGAVAELDEGSFRFVLAAMDSGGSSDARGAAVSVGSAATGNASR